MRSALVSIALIFPLCGFVFSTDNRHKLVWSDEFSGNSLSGNNWQTVVANAGPNDPNKQLQYYIASENNVNVQNGLLSLTAIQQSYTGAGGPTDTAQYTSGSIKSQYKIGFKYGKVVARIKVPKGLGLWPSFSMLPVNDVYGAWANSGQIILLNMRGSQTHNNIFQIYYGDYGPDYSQSNNYSTIADLSSAFHEYAVDWQPETITFSLDNVTVFTAKDWFASHLLKPNPLAPFDQPFYLALNLAVGGYFPGNPTQPQVFPASLQVDWIRIYNSTVTTAQSSGSSSSGGIAFGTTQIIAVVVVVGVVALVILLLRYFYTFSLRRRAASESPPLEMLESPSTSPDKPQAAGGVAKTSASTSPSAAGSGGTGKGAAGRSSSAPPLEGGELSEEARDGWSNNA